VDIKFFFNKKISIFHIKITKKIGETIRRFFYIIFAPLSNFLFPYKGKYLSINMPNFFVGLSHQHYNLQNLINYAYQNNYILLIPEFGLAGVHNAGKFSKNNLSKYFDYTKILVGQKPYKISTSKMFIRAMDITHLTIPKEKHIFASYFKIKKNIVTIPFQKYILKEAQSVTDVLKDFLCIHIRLKGTRNIIETKSSPEDIKNIILKWRKKTVYIMSDEKEKYDHLIIPGVKIFFYDDFPSLKRKKKQDNYYLYAIELCILKKASIKISNNKRGDWRGEKEMNDYL
jgi:hypothetical protein